MNHLDVLPPSIQPAITQKEPLLWLNDGWLPIEKARGQCSLSLENVHEAERRLRRFSRLLIHLFPELAVSHGIIDSPLVSANRWRRAQSVENHVAGRSLIKADHLLPVAGSIKARGGLYEVLWHAETLALTHGLIQAGDDPIVLASPNARAFFSMRQVVVGSTGNLGLSIGLMAAALGFHAVVHTSSDAKEWKKRRLRADGVEVVEHDGDFGVAVAAGRAIAGQNPMAYFVDDEHSEHLFLGYSVAALHLQRQLTSLDITVDAENPMFVYLPCGVGGGPGGITFGLRHIFGDHVHCFFAEPVASPCMLIRLASIEDRPISVRDVGLDNITEADGLAVGQASELVVRLIRPLVAGIFTVPDEHLFEDLYILERTEGFRIEPSAAAGFRGSRWLVESEQGRQYLSNHGLLNHMDSATHVMWTTGGALLPEDQYRQFSERGRIVRPQVPIQNKLS